MWDSWEIDHGCLRKRKAILRGYRRSFNKVSIKNWGTRECPGPTLNIVPANGSYCRGIAFEFQNENAPKIMAYLKQREGEGFYFPDCMIRFGLCSETTAIVSIYNGENILYDQSTDTLVEMALKAVGQRGKCTEYILNLNKKLLSMKIRDSVVHNLANEIMRREKAH